MAVRKLTDTQHYSDIADAIRSKTGGSALMKPEDMAAAIASIETGNAELEELMAGEATGIVTVSGVTDLGNTRIAVGQTTHGNPITELHMPDLENWCGKAGNSGRIRGGGLIDMSTSSSSSSASLEVLDIPKCTMLYMCNAENSNSNRNFSNLTTLNAPKLEELYGKMRYCGLTEIDLPELNVFNANFSNSVNLTTANLPKLLNINANFMYGCSALEYVYIGCENVPSGAFQNTALDTLVLPATSGSAAGWTHVDLVSTDALWGTPIAAGTGYVYVPQSLKSTYQSATNWSTYSSQIRAIEDYMIDGVFTPGV